MPGHHDYSETRGCIERAVGALDRARLAAGRTNLPPALGPQHVRAQLDHLEQMIDAAQDEIASARAACIAAGRRRLRVCG